MQDALIQSHSVVMLATTGETLVGCAVAWLIEDELQLLDIAVHPKYRRQGYGIYLLKALVTAAKSRGCTTAILEVSEHNAAAVQLYVQLGFQQVHVRRAYYKDGADALLMNMCL